jgi:hypothetical protein
MGVINTSAFGKALWPGVNAWWGKAYAEHSVQYTDLFNTYKTNKHYEEDVAISSFGLAPVKGEGEGVTYDSESQSFITRYTPVEYALGFIITEIMIEDNLYAEVAERRAQGLAFSMRQTKEIVGANVYNRAFSGSYVGGDGVSMCNAAHPNKAGGTWSNVGSADLSEAALEQAFIAINQWENDRGLKIAVNPVSLHVAPDEMFNAHRLLQSSGRIYDGATVFRNDANAMKDMGMLPGGCKVNNYFTDTDAWFIRTNAPDSLKYMERRADKFDQDDDFDTSNVKFKAAGRYTFGWTDPRGIYGSPGA